MEELKTVQQVADLTRQPVRRLREWCATGQLVCERNRMDWELPASQVPRVFALAAELGRLPDGRRAVALSVPTNSAMSDVVTQVARHLGVESRSLTTTRAAIDGTDRRLVAWPRACHKRAATVLATLADELDGELLDSGDDAS